MQSENQFPTAIFAELSPELAAWILRVAAKELKRDRPRWARVDLEELTGLLMFLHDAVPARYRTEVPALSTGAATQAA